MPIQVTELSYVYDRGTPLARKALDNIGFSIAEGSFMAIAGRTGSGKSTLAQNLDGLLTPTAGKIAYPQGIVVDMTPIARPHGQARLRRPHKLKRWKELRRMVGIVFQFPEAQLFKSTVLADVMVGPLNFGLVKSEAAKAAQSALRATGLGENFWDRSPFELSGGEKRRVALAGVLAFRPAFLILDEPTAGLDNGGAKQIMSYVRKLNASGTAVILITHDMDLVAAYCDRLLVLDDGKTIGDGKPTDLFADRALMARASLIPPDVFFYASYLRQQGLPLDISKAKDAASLAAEIRRCL